MAEQRKTAPAPWFVGAVAEGIARLYVLRLESAPAADTLDGVELVWVEALWYMPVKWDEELDAPRLAEGFRSLTQRLTRWPAPRELMECLPRRPKPRALPSPPISDEDRARNRQRIAEMMASLGMGPDDKKRSTSRGD